MKTLKSTLLALFACAILFPTYSNAQAEDAKDETKKVTTTLEFKNAAIASKLMQNYTTALQKGDVSAMNAQLHEKAVIYGLGGGTDSLTVAQHMEYFKNSTNQYKHAISGELYLPIKVENNWNEGEWLLTWGTNTVTDKKSGKEIEIPYHIAALVEGNKIVWMRYFYDMLNIAQSQGFTLTPPKM
jgi:ketosteroid isomerase-like protein